MVRDIHLRLAVGSVVQDCITVVTCVLTEDILPEHVIMLVVVNCKVGLKTQSLHIPHSTITTQEDARS